MNNRSLYSTYSSSDGLTERYYAMTSAPAETLEEEFDRLMEEYRAIAPDETSEVMLRLHLSDASSQIPYLRTRLSERKSFVSCIGQPPVNGARIALEAWHVEGIADRLKNINSVAVGIGSYRLIWSNLDQLKTSGSYDQTREEFEQLDSLITANGGNMADNLQRTWLYCDDIDNNYHGLVEARNSFFDLKGLTADTHFIASTGIQGRMETPSRIVKMDSLCLFGIDREQVEYMHALDHLCPTHQYGVAFERGTRIIYGDRSVYYISGTASIDKSGEVIHIGDPEKQTERAIENIKALMENHAGRLTDLKQAVVYLRNIEDRDIVHQVLQRSELAGIPYIMLVAPVCRPTWLVEIDAIAVNDKGDRRYPVFG